MIDSSEHIAVVNEDLKKSGVKAGDKVQVVTVDGPLDGIFIPAPENTDMILLKLTSGYNIGIDKKKVKSIHILEKHQTADSFPPSYTRKSYLPSITILHTGGTIASKVDYKTGGVIARFSPDEIVEMYPELGNIGNIHSRLVRNMWSEDMRFAHYNILAREVEKEIKAGANGIIITSGTDTLHYTAAALSFALHDLPIPVLIVGSQRSSDRGSSDSQLNLVCAAKFISESEFAGVAVCMHENMSDEICIIIPGTKVRKMHTSRRDAFRPINIKPIARVTQYKIDFLKKDYQKRDKHSHLKLMLFKEDLRVGLLKMHTNMYAEEFLGYAGFDGLLIEAGGLGQLPINEIDEFTKEHTKIFESIKSLIADGTVVALAPQTIYGQLQMNVYSPARKLQDIGALGHHNSMTPETSFIKLAWLLSNYPKDEVKVLFLQDLRGELKERIEPDDFLN